MVAAMTEALALRGEERVLEVGTGSGYQTAILAELARQVFSIERFSVLARQARRVLDDLGYFNTAIQVGDGTLGWTEYAPYDRILVTAGAPEVPATYPAQLAEGGIMVLPIGDAYSQVLTVVEKIKGKIRSHTLMGCVFVPLVGKYGWGAQNERPER
jgi:protein-L-isoaspartate(D-aspartate) O-methyltransferase